MNNPKMSSEDLRQSLAIVDVKLYELTIRKRLHHFDFHGRCARKKPSLSMKNIKAKQKLATENTDKEHGFWNNVLWTIPKKESHL